MLQSCLSSQKLFSNHGKWFQGEYFLIPTLLHKYAQQGSAYILTNQNVFDNFNA